MFVKHMIQSWRNKIVTAVQLIAPIVFAVIGCVVLKTMPGAVDPPALPLNISYFKSPVIPQYLSQSGSGGSSTSQMTTDYATVAGAWGRLTDVNADAGGYSNMDDYLLTSVVANASLGLYHYNSNYMLAATVGVDPTNGNVNLTAHFNNFAYHSIAMTLALADNTLLDFFVPAGAYSIETINHPLPLSPNTRANVDTATAMSTAFIFSYCLEFGMSFLIGTFVVFLVKERSVKSKHVQFVSGVRVLNFWMSTFAWDAINFVIPCVGIVIVVAIFKTTGYTYGSNLG